MRPPHPRLPHSRLGRRHCSLPCCTERFSDWATVTQRVQQRGWALELGCGPLEPAPPQAQGRPVLGHCGGSGREATELPVRPSAPPVGTAPPVAVYQAPMPAGGQGWAELCLYKPQRPLAWGRVGPSRSRAHRIAISQREGPAGTVFQGPWDSVGLAWPWHGLA